MKYKRHSFQFSVNKGELVAITKTYVNFDVAVVLATRAIRERTKDPRPQFIKILPPDPRARR